MVTIALDRGRSFLEQAQATLSIHHADSEGFCLGCLEMTARLSWVPCPHARWATDVLRHTGADGYRDIQCELS